MESMKSTAIIFLLAVGLLTLSAWAKPASVLLQEGLYAEEITGDLDAAIKIYEQVIAEAKGAQRTAAEATYRIGMCYLKKGEKAKASTQFNNLVNRFPEQKLIVDKARKQLSKLRSPIKVFEPQAIDELIKSGKVPAFKTQIFDNSGLDLETGVSVPFMNEWPAPCDVAWDNDGGGALMIKPMSSVRFLALGAAENWEDAISMARNSLDMLRTSTSKGMFASESKFAAVLTSERNLAVIQIGEYEANKGTIYGWVEKIPAGISCFGPVMERFINDDVEEKNSLIDFDTGRLFSNPTEFNSREALFRWIAENQIDAVSETKTSGPGLYGFDMAAIPIANERWNTISPMELEEDLSIAKVGTPAFMSAMGDLPVAYIFKTREGGMGVVQILEIQDNKKPRRIKIRYKMLQGETAQLRVSSHKVFLPECDTTVYDLLDLASNRIINSEPGGEVIDLSKPDGKGNLYFDKAKGQLWLVGVRGTRMRLRSGGELLSSEPDFISRGRNAYYLLGEISCQYLVTTAQGGKYELKVLSVETGDRPGVHIEYWKSAESPGEFAVATGVRGDAAKAMELLSGLKALMAGVVGAVESDDPNTALLLLDKLIAQSKQFKSPVKDTSVGAAVKASIELLEPLRDALEKKQMGRVKSLLAALNQMGPAVESALEKEAAKQKIAAKHSRRLADTIAEMGWDLRKFERFDKAEEVFKKALEMDPANASALKGLAVTCMERKEYGEAIKYYEMWLKAEPNNKDAKSGLEKAKAALKGK